MTLPTPPLLIVTDRTQAAMPLPDLARRLFALGVRWISLRDKDVPVADRLALARVLVETARPWSAAVTLHGDPALALEAGAAGVHLPDGGDVAAARGLLGTRALVGVSAHDEAGLIRARTAGADYATLSPLFPSASKPGYGPPIGAAELRRMAARGGVAIVGLGGIEDAAAVTACVAAGAAGVAAMGLAMRDPDAVAGLLSGLPTASARR